MTLTLAQAVTVAILTLSSFFCGWFLYRLRAKAAAGELQRSVLETKGMIPQLEATVRNREQRAVALAAEIDEWKSRLAAVESGLQEKDRELLARDRALRALNSELTLLKDAAAQANAAPAVDAAMLEALRGELAEAQRRNADLEARIANGAGSSAVAATQGTDAPARATPLPEPSPEVDALRAELSARDRALADLEERLQAESAHCSSLTTTLASQEAQLAEAREEIAKWRTRVPKLVESLKERDDRLAEAQGKVASFEDARASASRRTEALEAALAATKTALANAESTVHAALRAQQTAEDRLAALERERDALAARAVEAAGALTEREARLSALEAELATANAAAEESRKEFSKKLATSIRLGREEIDRMGKDLGGEIDRLTRDLGEAITRRNETLEMVSTLRAELDERQRSLDGVREQEASFEDERRAHAERVESLTRDRDSALAAQQATESRHAALLAELSERDARLTSLEAAARSAAAERASATEEAARGVEHRRGLEAECAALSRRLQVLSADLEASRTRLAEAELANRTAAEHAVQAANAAHEEALAALREELRQANARTTPLEELARQRETALGERAARIEALQDQLARLETTLADRSASRPEGQNNHEKVDYLEQRVATQFDRIRELGASLEERERTINELTRDQSLKDKSLAVLQQQLDHLNQANDRLAMELRELRSTAASPAAQDHAQPDPGPPPQRPQGLHARRPEEVDNLQQLRGIGAAFEHRLNELGIYQLKQIAALTEPEVVWLENELRMFRGRIDRDGWISQALDLLTATPWQRSVRADEPSSYATP
jgi:predicted flap endonuclease-1-like 5' DNA nuclease/predicted  nucleic acid-binding Zn-ribbon protein